jgi:hypothetical protein
MTDAVKKPSVRASAGKKKSATAAGGGKPTPVPAPPPAPDRRLTGSQLAEVMTLLEHVESVELKLTVPADSHRATIKGLPLDPVEAQPRQAFFFDTPDLALNQAGVVVRARRIQGGRADTVIKLRPVVPAELPASLRQSAACKIELDVLPGGFVCSASLKGNATGETVNDAIDGKLRLSRLFSKEQRAFYREHAPAGLDLDDLATLGPTFLLKSQFFVKKLDRRVVAEMWLYPDGSRILELSITAEPAEAFQVAAEFRAWLAKRGIETGGAQQTKTAAALKFFSTHLRAAAKSPKR